MNLSKSECNIVNETSSQSDSSDVWTNAITELNYDDNIEPSENVKEASYFNIFECGRNRLDHLYVTYQRAFSASETSPTIPTSSKTLKKQKSQYIIYLHHEKDIGICRQKFLQKRLLEWTKTILVRKYPK